MDKIKLNVVYYCFGRLKPIFCVNPVVLWSIIPSFYQLYSDMLPLFLTYSMFPNIQTNYEVSWDVEWDNQNHIMHGWGPVMSILVSDQREQVHVFGTSCTDAEI